MAPLLSPNAAYFNRALQWGFLLLAGVTATVLTRTAVIEAHEAKKIVPLQGDMLLIKPRYMQHLTDGGTLEVTAQQAAPNQLPPTQVHLSPVRAVVRRVSPPSVVVLEAAQGRYVLAEHTLYLSQNVRMQRNDGAWFQSQNAVIDTERGTVQTSGRVQVHLPAQSNLFPAKEKK